MTEDELEAATDAYIEQWYVSFNRPPTRYEELRAITRNDIKTAIKDNEEYKIREKWTERGLEPA